MAESTKIMELQGRLYAILNWQGRHSGSDELLAAPLTDDQNRQYVRFKRHGDSDSVIFAKLFPASRREPRRIIIRMSTLSKKAMAELIASKLSISAPSLEKMSREDLKNMLLALNNQR
jgi:hypothetical protein